MKIPVLNKKEIPEGLTICAECGKKFVATPQNSVNIKIYGLYGVVCKDCYERLKKEGKVEIIKLGPEGALR